MTQIFTVTQELIDASSTWRNTIRLIPTTLAARISQKCLKDLIRSIAESKHESGD
jgi:hypothetical protein